jgi:hypothetical protein
VPRRLGQQIAIASIATSRRYQQRHRIAVPAR